MVHNSWLRADHCQENSWKLERKEVIYRNYHPGNTFLYLFRVIKECKNRRTARFWFTIDKWQCELVIEPIQIYTFARGNAMHCHEYVFAGRVQTSFATWPHGPKLGRHNPDFGPIQYLATCFGIGMFEYYSDPFPRRWFQAGRMTSTDSYVFISVENRPMLSRVIQCQLVSAISDLIRFPA